MNLNKYTEKAQEAIVGAQALAGSVLASDDRGAQVLVDADGAGAGGTGDGDVDCAGARRRGDGDVFRVAVVPGIDFAAARDGCRVGCAEGRLLGTAVG